MTLITTSSAARTWPSRWGRGSKTRLEMLALRLIDADDYVVFEDGQLIGRIRLARERAPPIWLWTVTVTIPNPPYGDASSIDDAKARFKSAWLEFKQKHGAEALAQAYAEMQHASRPERNRK